MEKIGKKPVQHAAVCGIGGGTESRPVPVVHLGVWGMDAIVGDQRTLRREMPETNVAVRIGVRVVFTVGVLGESTPVPRRKRMQQTHGALPTRVRPTNREWWGGTRGRFGVTG